MDILVITINYPPEIGGAPHLIHALASNLKARGHDVTVLTGYPHYNIKEVPEQYRRGLWLKENLDGICVRRIRIPSLPRANKIARGLEHFISGLWLGGLTSVAPRADIAVVFSPPLPLPWLVSLVGKVRRMPVVVNIQDLFPREAVELGMLTQPALIRLFEVMESQVYRLATAVTVHSPGNKKHVVQHGGQPDRVQVVYNWVDTDHVRPGERNNDFARQNGLVGRFVVSYAGTMGWAQDMQTILAGAARLRDCADIVFLMVGDGVQKQQMQARSIELGLNNLIWLPMQPWSTYPQVLAASDVSMINLHPDLHTPVVPSKLLSIMAAARPVVASLPPESDARQIVAEAGCGICVKASDGAALADAILALYSDRALAREMGQRGRAYVEDHFSCRACVNEMEALFQKTLGEIR